MFIEPRRHVSKSDLISADIKCGALSVGVQMETSFGLICKSQNLLHSNGQLLGFLCTIIFRDLHLLINCLTEAMPAIC